jgi:hypothetical protein
MALKVRLHSFVEEYSQPEYVSPLFAVKNDTYATLRVFLVNEGFMDFAFGFWVVENRKCMLPRFEKFNLVGAKVE